MSNPTSLGLGYPIRTPSDHSSVDSSPRTIAASHVLHRLLMPRHPPCALDNLTNTPPTTTPRTPPHSNKQEHEDNGAEQPAVHTINTVIKQTKKSSTTLTGRGDQEKKMLASTVHLTTQPTDHHQHPTQPRRTSSDCPEKTPTPTPTTSRLTRAHQHDVRVVVLSGPNSAPTPPNRTPTTEDTTGTTCSVPHQSNKQPPHRDRHDSPPPPHRAAATRDG